MTAGEWKSRLTRFGRIDLGNLLDPVSYRLGAFRRQARHAEARRILEAWEFIWDSADGENSVPGRGRREHVLRLLDRLLDRRQRDRPMHGATALDAARRLLASRQSEFGAFWRPVFDAPLAALARAIEERSEPDLMRWRWAGIAYAQACLDLAISVAFEHRTVRASVRALGKQTERDWATASPLYWGLWTWRVACIAGTDLACLVNAQRASTRWWQLQCCHERMKAISEKCNAVLPHARGIAGEAVVAEALGSCETPEQKLLYLDRILSRDQNLAFDRRVSAASDRLARDLDALYEASAMSWDLPRSNPPAP